MLFLYIDFCFDLFFFSFSFFGLQAEFKEKNVDLDLGKHTKEIEESLRKSHPNPRLALTRSVGASAPHPSYPSPPVIFTPWHQKSVLQFVSLILLMALCLQRASNEETAIRNMRPQSTAVLISQRIGRKPKILSGVGLLRAPVPTVRIIATSP